MRSSRSLPTPPESGSRLFKGSRYGLRPNESLEVGADGFRVFRTRNASGNIETRFASGNDIHGRTLPYCGFVELRKPEPPRESHAHDTCEIHYVARGRMVFHTPEGLEHLGAGEVYVALPGEVHGNDVFTHVRAQVYTLMLGFARRGGLVGLDPTSSQALAEGLRGLRHRRIHAGISVGKLFEEIRKLGESFTAYSALRFRLKVLEIVLALLESGRSEKAHRHSPFIERVLQAIRRDPVNARLETLSRLSGLGASGFRHRFLRETGLSPKEFILREKVGSAAKLLRAKERDLTGIAFETGFASSQSFARMFRKYTGKSPSEYRKTP